MENSNTDHNFIIERLLELNGPSGEVDWLIATFFNYVPAHTVREQGWDYVWHRQPHEFILHKADDSEGRRISSWSPSKYTSSVDAVLNLIATELPGNQSIIINQAEDKLSRHGYSSGTDFTSQLARFMLVELFQIV